MIGRRQRRATRALSTSLLLVALVAGCASVGPTYEPPVISTPDAWSLKVAQEVAQGPAALLQTWWQVFDDPVLDELIAQARAENLDLRIALSRVRQSRSLLAITQGQKQPEVEASASAVESKVSDDGPLQQVVPPGGFERQTQLVLGLDALWEIDVFGRVRRSIEAAGAQYEASIEDYRDVLVTLLAEVALSYVDIRSTQRLIDLTRENALAQEESLALAVDRFESGVTSELDVTQAESSLLETRASIPPLEISLHQAQNRLAVLLGRDAGTLRDRFVGAGSVPTPRRAIGVGVPADVLRQRPDIRRAERMVAAQTAQIGVATADLYPTFSLGGLLGLRSRSASNLLDSSSVAWAVGVPVKWNVFDRRRIRNNIALQDERTEERLLAYEKQVLNAVREVEDAIVAFDANGNRAEILMHATEATSKAVDLVLIRYNSGLTEFDNVVQSQRTLLDQQSQLAATRAEVSVNLISLYKALGGGWDLGDPTGSETDATEGHSGGSTGDSERASDPDSGEGTGVASLPDRG